jgi:hypothetical protein
MTPVGEGAPSARDVDVVHTLRLARTQFRGSIDIDVGGTAAWELNRDFRRDAFNLRLDVSARLGW